MKAEENRSSGASSEGIPRVLPAPPSFQAARQHQIAPCPGLRGRGRAGSPPPLRGSRCRGVPAGPCASCGSCTGPSCCSGVSPGVSPGVSGVSPGLSSAVGSGGAGRRRKPSSAPGSGGAPLAPAPPSSSSSSPSGGRGRSPGMPGAAGTRPRSPRKRGSRGARGSDPHPVGRPGHLPAARAVPGVRGLRRARVLYRGGVSGSSGLRGVSFGSLGPAPAWGRETPPSRDSFPATPTVPHPAGPGTGNGNGHRAPAGGHTEGWPGRAGVWELNAGDGDIPKLDVSPCATLCHPVPPETLQRTGSDAKSWWPPRPLRHRCRGSPEPHPGHRPSSAPHPPPSAAGRCLWGAGWHPQRPDQR